MKRKENPHPLVIEEYISVDIVEIRMEDGNPVTQWYYYYVFTKRQILHNLSLCILVIIQIHKIIDICIT